MKAKRWIGFLAACCLLFGGCQTPDEMAPYQEKVSEVRNGYYAGESEHFEVEVYAGEREEPFRADGIAEPREVYFLVMVFPKSDLERQDVSVSFEADRLYQATLFKNPAFDSYAYDFGAVERRDGNFRIEVCCGNFIEEVTLLQLSLDLEDDWKDVLRKGVEAFHQKDDWQQREAGGFEIGVRLVRDTETNSELCWHYMMVFPDGSVWGKIFPCKAEEPDTGEEPGSEDETQGNLQTEGNDL